MIMNINTFVFFFCIFLIIAHLQNSLRRNFLRRSNQNRKWKKDPLLSFWKPLKIYFYVISRSNHVQKRENSASSSKRAKKCHFSHSHFYEWAFIFALYCLNASIYAVSDNFRTCGLNDTAQIGLRFSFLDATLESVIRNHNHFIGSSKVNQKWSACRRNNICQSIRVSSENWPKVEYSLVFHSNW